MAFESVNYQCPACGGPLHFASAEQKLVCDYCDSRFEVEEVEALYRERQDKADAKADAAAATPKPVADDAVQELAQNAGYICSSCGAELVSDGTVAVTTCPYCGNSAVAPGQLSGDFSPDLVIPFKLGRDDVTAALKEHYKGKILLPKSFVTGNHIDEVQGVYVPFWLYGARVDGEVYFDATNETVTEESDRTVTTTDHYDAYRKGNISFKRVPVDGSSKMPDGHMDAIEPFDYDALRPFSVAYMPGYIANRYDEDCETCKARAERRMEESTISALRETVVDEYDDATVESKQLDYTWEDSDYALFPVWMLSTSWNGKSYLFAMNGQTGRLVGELPCSKPKLAIASVLFFVIGVMKTCGSFAELKKPEHALKVFIRFALAKAAVTYGLELMMALFNIVQGLISTIMTAAGFGTAGRTVLPSEIVTAVEDCGFFESIPLWAVTLIGGLFITVLSFIMIMTVYGRFFKLYLYTAIAPVPLSAFAGEPSQNVGKSFIKSYAAVCLEGAIIVLACIVFSLFASAPPVVDPNAAAVSMVWSYIGELVFNMLVLVGAVKMADRVVREMMGL